MSGRCATKSGPVRPSSAQVWPISGKIRSIAVPNSDEVGRCCAQFGRGVGRVRPQSVEFGPSFVDSGPVLVDVVANLGTFGPKSTGFGPVSAKFDRDAAKFGPIDRRWPGWRQSPRSASQDCERPSCRNANCATWRNFRGEIFG